MLYEPTAELFRDHGLTGHGERIVPVEWRQGHRLSLKITGPHAGKARDDGYPGAAIVAVDLPRKTATKIYERIE